MQNEFEKQVRQKMEELKFTPSVPVWENIAEQIRRKKEKRRILFWLPLAILLTAGGGWLFFQQNNSSSSSSTSNTSSPLGIPSTSASGTPSHSDASSGTTLPEPTTVLENKTTNQNISIKATQLPEKASELTSISKNKNPKSSAAGYPPALSRGNRLASTMVKSTARNPVVRKEAFETFNDTPDRQPGSSENETQILHIKELQHGPLEMHFSALPLPVEKELPTQPLVIAAPAAPIAFRHAKWNFGVTASAGISGVGNGLFNNEGQKNASPTTLRPPLMAYNSSSTVENTFSYGLGLLVQRRISDKFNLSSGLEYMQAGTKTRMTTQVTYANSSFIGQNANAAQSIELRNYYKRYHFVSLPLVAGFQPFRKAPFQLRGGASLKKLIATGSETPPQASAANMAALKKWQVFSSFGFDYSFGGSKSQIVIGPEVNYGLSRLDNADLPSHLFTFGLRTRLLLKK